MGTYNLRRLCRPEILRAIDSRYLEELLAPYERYLGEHGVALPLSGREAPLKYLALVKLITAPPEDMPRELFDAFYFIDELATPSGLKALEDAAKAAGTPVPRSFCEVTPADVTLQVWLRNRPLLERVHAEMAVQRFRSFEYFQSEAPKAAELPGSLPARIRAVEAELNDCFQARRRGRYARIIVDQREDMPCGCTSDTGVC